MCGPLGLAMASASHQAPVCFDHRRADGRDARTASKDGSMNNETRTPAPQ
jgi:hypothetical protein